MDDDRYEHLNVDKISKGQAVILIGCVAILLLIVLTVASQVIL